MSGRSQVLRAIRQALGSNRPVSLPPDRPDPLPGLDRAALVERFTAEAEAVDAEVVRGAAGSILEERFGAERLAAAIGPTDPIEADRREVPLAVTRAAWAIADTGTVIEFHPIGSSSAASAIASTHVAIVSEDRILPDLAAFYRRLAGALAGPDEPRYAVLITGPSRTADVEQTLVLGAHGPRELLIVVEPADGMDPEVARSHDEPVQR